MSSRSHTDRHGADLPALAAISTLLEDIAEIVAVGAPAALDDVL